MASSEPACHVCGNDEGHGIAVVEPPPSPCRAFDAKINHSFENQTSALASRKCRDRNYIRAVM